MKRLAVKRRLWEDLLRTALGEVVQGDEFDDLFVRHTYLTMVVGIVVQATFGLDVNQIAENDPEDLLKGRQFSEATGLHGVIETDFFAWPIEVGAASLIKTIARRVAKIRLVIAADRRCGDALPDGDTGAGAS